MRSKFDQQLALLNKEMIEMGALCEEIISDVLRALLQKDNTFLNEIPSLGAEIDRKERAIETLCLKLLLQQQPVAKDLRQISAALKMITDMERIGDQAEDIAEITPFVTNRPPAIDTLLHKMAESSIKMVTKSVDAFVEQELIHEIIECTNDGECYIDLLMISKYFERIADHATNIAEWVVFSVTGIHKEG